MPHIKIRMDIDTYNYEDFKGLVVIQMYLPQFINESRGPQEIRCYCKN